MTTSERKSRILARGEVTGHCHIITGEAMIRNEHGEILIDIEGKAAIRHLLESAWLSGSEDFTNEHGDIDLTEMPPMIRHGDVLLEKVGDHTYKYLGQSEYDPYDQMIKHVKD